MTKTKVMTTTKYDGNLMTTIRIASRLVDVFYTMKWDAVTNMPYYLGFLKSVIR